MYTVQQFAGQQMRPQQYQYGTVGRLLSPADHQTCPACSQSMMPMIMMIMMMAILMPMMKGMTGNSKS